MASGQLVGAIGYDQQQRQLLDAAGNVPEELETGRVRPVQVFEHDQNRSHRGKGSHEASHLGKEPGLAGNAFQPAVDERSRRRR